MLIGHTGCTAFALPRPARVQPGPSFTTTLAVATPPGDPAAWFWSYECTSNCNRMMLSPAFQFMYGLPNATGGARSEVGAGLNGLLFPFLEGYRRLDRPGRRPWGLGARLGIPIDGHGEHQLYARFDLRERDDVVFVNPTLFFHHAPNGSFKAFAGVIGLHENGLTLSVAPTVGWTERPESAAPDEREGVALFAVFAAAFTIGHGDDDDGREDAER